MSSVKLGSNTALPPRLPLTAVGGGEENPGTLGLAGIRNTAEGEVEALLHTTPL